MGMDGFVWFTGVVEDRDDPDQLGRVRVRCLGFHTQDKNRIPTKDLPWAHVMHPVTDPSMNGMGHTPSFMVEGSWVLGFFRDADEKQQPIIIGTLPGIPESLGNPNLGFNDPNRRNDDPEREGYNTSVYPRETGHSDVNRLARNTDLAQTVVATKKAKIIKNIEKADGEQYNEPITSYNALYPKNHVFESESGHIIEYDDSPRHQRVHHYHASGTFNEISAGGDMVEKVVGDNYQLVNGSGFDFVNGDLNITVEGTLNIKCRKLNLEVSEDYTEEVEGNKATLIKGTNTTDITGAVKEDYGSTYAQSIIGKTTKKFGDTLTNYHLATIQADDTISTPTVTNHHEADVLNYITGKTQFHTSTNFEIYSDATVGIDADTVDIDATTTTTIDSATINFNSGTVSVDSATAPDTDDIEVETVQKPIVAVTEPKSATVGGDQDDEDAEEPRGNGSGSVGTGGRVGPQKTREEGAIVTGASQPGNSGQLLAAQNPPSNCKRKTLGQVSRVWESSGDPSATNDDTAADDLGGWSYGLYQIASKNDAMKPFLKFCSVKENGFSDIHAELDAAGGNSAALQGPGAGFYEKWKELARRDGDRFSQCQHDYIQTVYYDRQVTKFFEFSGIDVCDGTHSDGIQDAIWSTAVQHGPNTSTVIDAFKATGKTKDTVTDEDLINAIYDERGKENKEAVYVKKKRQSKWWGYQNYIPTEGGTSGGKVLVYDEWAQVVGTTPQLHRFRSSSGRIQKGVKDRYVAERASCLALNINTRFNVGFTTTGGGQVV